MDEDVGGGEGDKPANPTGRSLHAGLSYVIDVLPDPAEHAEDY